MNKPQKIVYLRMSEEQYRSLVDGALKEGVSLNTFCLRQLGMETPYRQTENKTGPKLKG